MLLAAFPQTLLALDELGLGPLSVIERDEEGGESADLFGPFVTSRRDESGSEFGIRPLFYLMENYPQKKKEYHFLYPFSVYREDDEGARLQALFYLLSFETKTTEDGYREKEFTLFPFIFSKSARNREDSYFAFFPLYGEIKKKFFRDEIRFFLFPLFLQTKKGEEINTSYFWPLFGYYSGGGQEGFRFWPLFGYRKKGERFDEKFALWPIYASKRQFFYDDEVHSFTLFPLYLTVRSKERSTTTYLWPLFNYSVDREKGYRRWDVPWPLFNITRGLDGEEAPRRRQERFFPFYSRSIEKEDRDGFLLWPLYRYSDTAYKDHRRRRDTLLLFLYSDVRETPTVEGGRSGRRVDLWPLFSYQRDREGRRLFHFLTLLEPFLGNHAGIEKNYAPFWRIFTWEKTPEGIEKSSFLWNLFRSKRSPEGFTFMFQPIVPVFHYKNLEHGKGFSLLGGLIGFTKTETRAQFRFLYVPITLSSSHTSSGGED
jgi:hypothetical protein